MRIGVWTSNRVLAKDTIAELEKTIGRIARRRLSLLEAWVEDEDGNIIQWIRPSENSRGHKMNKAYVDVNVSIDILNTVIMPTLLQESFEDIVWIAETQTSVYRYLQALPQEMFEAALLRMMGLPYNLETKESMHAIMQCPYQEVFLHTSLSSLASNVDLSLNFNVIPRNAAMIVVPSEKQEQLRLAMREYCEICDKDGRS